MQALVLDSHDGREKSLEDSECSGDDQVDRNESFNRTLVKVDGSYVSQDHKSKAQSAIQLYIMCVESINENE